MEADRVLDCKGQVCPMPLIRTRKLLEEMAVGKVLLIEGDHKKSVTDIVTTVKELGSEILKFENKKGSKDWKIYIKK